MTSSRRTDWCAPVLALVCLLGPETAAASAGITGPDALERSRTAIEAIRKGQPDCRLEPDGAVRYIGPTDDSLLACLAEYARDGRSLFISSGGGDGRKAIEAGNALSALGWGIRVLGMCASSCGNYVVPAATLVTVDPYSAILLHGGPIDSESFIRAVQDQVEAKQRAAYPDVSDAFVADGRALMRSVVLLAIEEHRQFVDRYTVSPEWYDLSEFRGPPGGFTPSDFAVADPEYVSRQLPRVEQAEYWFPRSDEDRAAMAALIPDASLFYRP